MCLPPGTVKVESERRVCEQFVSERESDVRPTLLQHRAAFQTCSRKHGNALDHFPYEFERLNVAGTTEREGVWQRNSLESLLPAKYFEKRRPP